MMARFSSTLMFFVVRISMALVLGGGADAFSARTVLTSSFSQKRRCSLNSQKSEKDSALSDHAMPLALLRMLMPAEGCKPELMSGTDLAYIGDVVFELFVRSRTVWPSRKTSDLQNVVVGLVRAEYQSGLLSSLREGFPLTDSERQVLARGRNAVTRSKNRRNPAAYQDSTAFEALVGYLYISDHARLEKLLAWVDEEIGEH